MPTMPPLVSTSTTRMLRVSPNAWPLSHGSSGHGMRRMVVRTDVMVMSVMGKALPPGHARATGPAGAGPAVNPSRTSTSFLLPVSKTWMTGTRRTRPGMTSQSCLTECPVSPRHRVIHAVRPHVGRARHTIAHVEEACHRGDVPDVARGEAGAAKLVAIFLLDRPRLGGELDREVEHGAL